MCFSPLFLQKIEPLIQRLGRVLVFCFWDLAQERVRHRAAAELVTIDRGAVQHARIARQDTVSEP